jgi:hypothetical protein
MASFCAPAVENDFGVPADFPVNDVLERVELPGDDDEIARVQLNHPT